jgi:hypothetical protein
MKPRKVRTNGAKSKNKEPESLLEQLSGPLRDFVVDFKTYGKTVLEQVRQENPAKYLEMASKLAALVAALRPEPDGYSKAQSMQDVGRKLLQSVGADETMLSEQQIAEAVEAHDAFTAQLEAIRDAAQGYSSEGDLH